MQESESSENGTETMLSFRCPQRLAEELDRIAEKEERDRSFLLRKLVEFGVNTDPEVWL